MNLFGIEIHQIPGGTFLMGSSDDGPLINNAEIPQHTVNIKPFAMSIHPITQAQWRLGASLSEVEVSLDPDPSNFRGDNLPVERVSWIEATEFCKRLALHTGLYYHLPSESQWEYACRSGSTTRFYVGDIMSSDLANFRDSPNFSSRPTAPFQNRTTEVGSYPPNDFGLYDMHGNVMEWCFDAWSSDYQDTPRDGSPFRNNQGNSFKVVRGGSAFSLGRQCASAYRTFDNQTVKVLDIGFRVAIGGF
jgi:formylglycine-generating enzyme required for sulfatase activity